jgi:NAD(P)-dependent dehydrogenase (short-subunit alcohol dehydrogenase family)
MDAVGEKVVLITGAANGIGAEVASGRAPERTNRKEQPDMSSMDHLIDQYFEEHFAEGVKVPTNVSEDDAIRSVQEQFDDAGIDCSEQTARGLVHEAWRRAAE